MEIRNLALKDLEQIDKLYYQFWQENSDMEKMKKMFRELETNSNYIFLAAEEEGIVAGTVMGIICYELYGDCRPFMLLEDLVVDRRFRKRGIGKALVKKLEEEAEKRGCSQIMFITEAERKDAVSFYESLDYDSGKNTGFKKKIT